jgi:hypothetical protein
MTLANHINRCPRWLRRIVVPVYKLILCAGWSERFRADIEEFRLLCFLYPKREDFNGHGKEFEATTRKYLRKDVATATSQAYSETPLDAPKLDTVTFACQVAWLIWIVRKQAYRLRCRLWPMVEEVIAAKLESTKKRILTSQKDFVETVKSTREKILKTGTLENVRKRTGDKNAQEMAARIAAKGITPSEQWRQENTAYARDGKRD